MSKYQYETVLVNVSPEGVAHLILNRPKTLNSFSDQLFFDVRDAFNSFSLDGDIRSVVISAVGRFFTSGLDLANTKLEEAVDPARRAFNTRHYVKSLQDCFTAIEKCVKPVIVAIQGGCIGAGVDLITACDIRYCTKDAFFSVKEVDVGLAADVGTLQRLPKVIGHGSLVRELCITARNLYAEEAFKCGLVSKVLENQEEAVAAALKTAAFIATKSPVAVIGTKHILNYTRDHSVAESLDYVVTWNQAMLNTEDIPLSFQAIRTKKPAKYSKM